MKAKPISLRRRHLMMAGVVGAATPVIGWAAQCGAGTSASAAAITEFYTGGGVEKLVVSGRIVDAACQPLTGVTVDTWTADARGNPACTVATDGDGRFVFSLDAPTGKHGRPRHLNYRVSREGRELTTAQLHFTQERGIPAQQVADLRRDEAQAWRATFGLTVV
jgi:protocatechuate 3,4-dioxygenase beta subunit